MLKDSKQNLIISLSGGKDSTAMLLLMIERKEPIHSVVFFDTGWEFPEMYAHLERLEKYTRLKIVRLYPKISFDNITIKYSWPQIWFRKCTGIKGDMLKTYHGKNKPYASCRGVAFDEKSRTLKGKGREHKGCSVRFPLIEWGITEKQALKYCYKHGFDWNGLYTHFDRVSCFCCPFRKIGDYRKTRKHYPVLWKRMLKLDKMINPKRGFYGYKTVHDLDRRFLEEDRQLPLLLF